jgi:hypothetical protein
MILLNGQEGSDTSRVLSFALTWLAILIWDRGISLKARTGQAPRPGVGSN